jgi:hypothetical protein
MEQNEDRRRINYTQENNLCSESQEDGYGTESTLG